MQPLRVCDSKRAGAEVLCKQAPQVAAGHAETLGQKFDVAVLQRAFGNQAHAAINRRGRARPGRRTRRAFGATPKARPEPRFACCRGRGIEDNVLALGRSRRADRPAVDARRLHADKEAPVESGVS